jgi:hypothetical protein
MLTACTNDARDTHFLESFFIPDDDRGKAKNTVAGKSLDIKQRLLISTMTDTKRVTCAEPSPDAISQLAAQFSASLSAEVTGTGGGSAAVSKSFQESARSIGKRTATIQLLRDLLYRDYEAHANGMDKDFSYHIKLANMDRVVLQMIAVEGLSEAAIEPADADAKEAISTAAAAQSELNGLAGTKAEAQTVLRQLQTRKRARASSLRSKTGLKAKVDKEIDKLGTEITKQEALRDKPATAAANKPAIQKTIDRLSKEKIDKEGSAARLESDIGGLTTEIAAIGTEIGNAETKHAQAIGAMTAEKLKDLQSKIAGGRLAKKKANASVAAIIREIVQPSDDKLGQKKLSLVAACMMWLGANPDQGQTPLAQTCYTILKAQKWSSAK